MIMLLTIYFILFALVVIIIYWFIDKQLDQKSDKLLFLLLAIFAPITIILLIISLIKELTE